MIGAPMLQRVRDRFHKDHSCGTMRSAPGSDYVVSAPRAAGDAAAPQAEKTLRTVLEGRASGPRASTWRIPPARNGGSR